MTSRRWTCSIRFVPAHKIGSGDITWPEMLRHIAGKGKPVLLATGASTLGDVQRAVDIILAINPQLVLMQCNTNYTASLENFHHIHLNVLRTYAAMYPDLVLGLSDHTPGHATVLGAVALGARVVEKHFTDDNAREGPDHPFSMTPRRGARWSTGRVSWRHALGSPEKRVADNEQDTVIVQRRCLRAGQARHSGRGATDTRDDRRPAPGAGRKHPAVRDRGGGGHSAAVDIPAGEALRWTMLRELVRVLYFTRGYTAHDHRFLAKLAQTGNEIGYLRLELPGCGDDPHALPEGIRDLELRRHRRGRSRGTTRVWPVRCGRCWTTFGRTSCMPALCRMAPCWRLAGVRRW